MGWSDCGTDSKGRSIGYGFSATCDYPGCSEKINRGLSYACGGMHGENEGWTCEGYFCSEHLKFVCGPIGILDSAELCPDCKKTLGKISYL